MRTTWEMPSETVEEIFGLSSLIGTGRHGRRGRAGLRRPSLSNPSKPDVDSDVCTARDHCAHGHLVLRR
jgi:hypothetical protein